LSYRASARYVAFAPAWWRVALALAAALVWQSTLGSFVVVRGATVSFVLLVVLWYGFRSGARGGLLFGLIAGACEDALAGGTGAAWTFATALVGFGAGRTAGTPLVESRLTLVPYVALATLFRFGVFAIVLRLEGHLLPLPVAHLHAIVWQSLLNALVTFALLQFFGDLSVAREYRR